MNEQRRIDSLGVNARKELQLALQFDSQFVLGRRVGNGVANLSLDVHRLGERTEVQPDDRAFEPALGRFDRR